MVTDPENLDANKGLWNTGNIHNVLSLRNNGISLGKTTFHYFYVIH